MLRQFNIQSIFEVPQEGYNESLIQAHKLVLIDKIKKYGNYTDININDINELLVYMVSKLAYPNCTQYIILI